MSEENFFSRWARRKNEVRGGRTPEEAPREPVAERPAAPVAPPAARTEPAREASPAAAGAAAPTEEALPLPSMEDVARLTRDSDYSAFMRRGVDEDVKRAAMKKLFTDPHYNVMDGLDIYIDDYSKPDPIPASMLRKMAQSKMLGLFRDEEGENEKAAAVADATPAAVPTDDGTGADVPQSRAAEDVGPAPAAAAPPNAPDAAEAPAGDGAPPTAAAGAPAGPERPAS